MFVHGVQLGHEHHAGLLLDCKASGFLTSCWAERI